MSTKQNQIRISSITKKALKDLRGLGAPDQKKVIRTLNQPVPVNKYERFSNGLAAKHKLAHVHVTDNLLLLAQKQDNQVIVIGIGMHKEITRRADSYAGGMPSDMLNFEEAGISLSGAELLQSDEITLTPERLAETETAAREQASAAEPNPPALSGRPAEEDLTKALGAFVRASLAGELDVVVHEVAQLNQQFISEGGVNARIKILEAALRTELGQLNQRLAELSQQWEKSAVVLQHLHANELPSLRDELEHSSAFLKDLAADSTGQGHRLDQVVNTLQQSMTQASQRSDAVVQSLALLQNDVTVGHSTLQSRLDERANETGIRLAALESAAVTATAAMVAARQANDAATRLRDDTASQLTELRDEIAPAFHTTSEQMHALRERCEQLSEQVRCAAQQQAKADEALTATQCRLESLFAEQQKGWFQRGVETIRGWFGSDEPRR